MFEVLSMTRNGYLWRRGALLEILSPFLKGGGLCPMLESLTSLPLSLDRFQSDSKVSGTVFGGFLSLFPTSRLGNGL